MKQTLIILFLVISVITFGQTANKPNDSATIKQAELDAKIEQVITKTSIKELQEFFYKNAVAEFYDRFWEVYNAFIQKKLAELKSKKQ